MISLPRQGYEDRAGYAATFVVSAAVSYVITLFVEVSGSAVVEVADGAGQCRE
jgi:hypothetical protein